ncbi:hypothetical protein CJF30_00005354 [Rutstroemia sp. NJR-2017a BBW]|nr:hypothetical protein CJF30_00005354 [Rutstroemia sp. NJR-2017a BBW]
MATPESTSAKPNISIIPASTAKHIEQARRLFMLYADSLGIDLTFQSFSSELANLPGAYAPPTGCLLLAYIDLPLPDMEPHGAVACIAVRPLPYAYPVVSDSSASSSSDPPLPTPTAELKRLFTLPSTRGHGLARQLITHALSSAQSLGYRRVVLDTLPSMRAAISLYRSFGFRDLKAGYYDTPLEGTIFLGREL